MGVPGKQISSCYDGGRQTLGDDFTIPYLPGDANHHDLIWCIFYGHLSITLRTLMRKVMVLVFTVKKNFTK
jgi:hypothetical protein